MKPWRWFVGQVVRLRRSIVDTLRRQRTDEAAPGDEPRSGPPEHWVERVRQGAPGLLEPSFRQRNGSSEPAGRATAPATEPAPPAEPLEQIERDETPLELPAKVSRLRKMLHRRPARPAREAEAAPAAPPEELAREATPRVSERSDFAPAPPPQRERHRGEPEADRSPHPAGVVELDGPVELRAPRPERAASTVRPIEAHASAEERVRRSEPEVTTERVLKEAVPIPSLKRASEATRVVEPAARRPLPLREPPAEPPPTPSRPEPLTDVEVHPWPELPPPLDNEDSDVETALRAWEHQQRLDREQTRL